MAVTGISIPERSVRFGDCELNASAFELRRGRRTVKLERIPLQVLLMLIEEHGKVVTREAIADRIWGKGVFMDVDNGINTAIRKIRQVLNDDSQSPRFVETIPGMGYRFIAPLEKTEVLPPNGLEPVEPEPAREPEPLRPPWRQKPALVALALSVALVVGGAYYRSRYAKPGLTEKGTIVLADFANTTGDSVFDDTLKQGLAVQLSQSPFLDLVSERKVNETLKLMGQPSGDRLTPEVAREVCQRTSSAAIVDGSIAGLGSQYVIGVRVVNCNSGDVLSELQEQAANKESVLKALNSMAVSVRNKLGESHRSVQQYAVPLYEATTPSLEALKAFSLGRKTQLAEGDNAALPFYKRAVELDPNFALAYAALASTYNNLNEQGQSLENAHKAYELRAKVSERERFIIEAIYRETTGELEKAAQVNEQWKQTYPRDYVPYGNLGVIYASLGNWEQALEEAREAHRREPNAANTYANLGVDYASLNRLDEADAVYKEAQNRKLGDELLPSYRYELAFLEGDTIQMTQLAAAAKGKAGMEDLLLAQEADTAAWYGKYKLARDLTKAAMESAQLNDLKETAATYQAAAALREVEVGNAKRARADAIAAAKLAPSRDVWAMGALALARAGDIAAAESLASDLDKTYPLDTIVQRYTLPSIRAATALEQKDSNRAVEQLKVTSAIELAAPTDLTVFLCQAYLRGEAFLMLHDGSRAAAEFQKFIDHRGLVANFPWGALARLGLARAYAVQRDSAKAKAAYQDFLTLWKEADPDIPIYKQAKAEYAKLQ